ncbi:MAG: hypothetical protein K0R46_2391, partial [Herbinix sp.]|nr:hypothetical protein [Herbinix sp.]
TDKTNTMQISNYLMDYIDGPGIKSQKEYYNYHTHSSGLTLLTIEP